MANRRKKGREVSGWLCLDKPVGTTSTQAVATIKRLFGAQKVGHAGTLDPLASGALPIALGEATKTVPYVQDGRKVYRFTVQWGVETDTDDADGKPVATSNERPGREAIEAKLPAFVGEIMQRPPAYSAIKVDGNRAYDLARDGEEVVLQERPVSIHRLVLVDVPDRDHAVLEAECGKGTYVRAIARDLGQQLGCRGHVVALRRLTVGPFDPETLVRLDDLIAAREAAPEPDALDHFLRPLGFGLAELPEIALNGNDAARLRRGQPVLIRGRDAPPAGTIHVTHGGQSVAIGEVERGEFHPRRVFQG